MARITVEDCQERVENRFLLVQMAIKRVRQYREGYEPLVESRNKEAVTALREIAAGKIFLRICPSIVCPQAKRNLTWTTSPFCLERFEPLWPNAIIMKFSV